MNPSTTALTLNMQLPNIAAVSWAVQGNQLAREITATLIDGSVAWTPGSNYHGVIRYHKPDGTSGVYDTDEDGNLAVTWEGNVATLKIAQQALTYPGTVMMQLEFYDSSDARITAFGWANNVQPSAVTDTEFMSTDYYNLLTLQIAGVLGATSHPPYINSVTKNWMIWDEGTANYVDSGYSSIGNTGPAPLVTNTSYQYANSSSGTVVPSSWSDTRPATSPGTWQWTKTTITYDTGNTTTLYSTAYQGQDGQGAPGTSTPLPNAQTGNVGTSITYSREDHVHPFDATAWVVVPSIPYMQYKKLNGIVFFQIASGGSSQSFTPSGRQIGAMPEGFRPPFQMDFPLTPAGGQSFVFLRIDPDGTVTGFANPTYQYYSGAGSYPI